MAGGEPDPEYETIQTRLFPLSAAAYFHQHLLFSRNFIASRDAGATFQRNNCVALPASASKSTIKHSKAVKSSRFNGRINSPAITLATVIPRQKRRRRALMLQRCLKRKLIFNHITGNSAPSSVET